MLLYSTRKMNTRKIYHGLLSKIVYCFTVFFGRRRTKIKPSSDWSEPMLLQFHSFYIFLPCVICGKCMWRDKYQVVTHCDKRQRTECPRPFLKALSGFCGLRNLFSRVSSHFLRTHDIGYSSNGHYLFIMAHFIQNFWHPTDNPWKKKRMVSIKFLLVITTLFKTKWS